MKKVLVPIAPGFEEIEAITVIDILRRAGIDVIVAGVEPGPIIGRNLISILPDRLLSEAAGADYDMIVLPGGAAGADYLKKDPVMQRILEKASFNQRYIAAICAAPTVLAEAGLLAGKTVTSHPSVQDQLAGVRYTEERVVVDGRIVTSRGPGTAMEFSMTLVELLENRQLADQIRKGVLC